MSQQPHDFIFDSLISMDMREHTAVTFSNNGLSIIWDLKDIISTRTVRSLYPIPCHSAQITAHCFYGDLLLTGSTDFCIKAFRIWNCKVIRAHSYSSFKKKKSKFHFLHSQSQQIIT